MEGRKIGKSWTIYIAISLKCWKNLKIHIYVYFEDWKKSGNITARHMCMRGKIVVTIGTINKIVYIKKDLCFQHTGSTLFCTDLASSLYVGRILTLFEDNNVLFVPQDSTHRIH